MKRFLDILFSCIAIVVLSPVLIPVMVILRFTGEGYIFFRQERVGKGGRTFTMYKFATMLKDSPNLPGGLFTKRNDPRVFPFGQILRATKVNEFPQLLNVLKGEMSLIGPRPQAIPHFEVFPEHVKREIIKVRPGLSGIGSVIFRNEESLLARCGMDKSLCYERDIAPYKGELEVWYVRNQSLKVDFLLVALTIWAILLPKSKHHFKVMKNLPQPNSAIVSSWMA